MGSLVHRTDARGRRVYTYRYFTLGRNRRITFGPVPKRQAEEWFHFCEAHLRRGTDPRKIWDEEKSAAQAASAIVEEVDQDSESDFSLQEQIDRYISSSSSRGNSPDTIKRKRYLLGTLIPVLGNKDVREFKPEDIEKWLDHYGSDKRAATKNSAFREIRAFLIWLEKREVIARSPHRALIGMRQPPPVPKQTLSPQEIRLLLEHMDENSDLFRAVTIALHTAMRLGEIVDLNWTDVDLEANTIQLKHTKAGRHQVVPISDHLAVQLSKWQESGLPKPVTYAHKSNISQLFSKLRDELGFHSEITFHCLRRTAATQLLANGASIFYVSKLLRHSSVAVTEMYYAHVIPSKLKDTADQLSSLLEQEV